MLISTRTGRRPSENTSVPSVATVQPETPLKKRKARRPPTPGVADTTGVAVGTGVKPGDGSVGVGLGDGVNVGAGVG
jgi:hypothetical protein